MKNWIKLFGIIALVAVMGFSMVACKEEEEEPITLFDAASGEQTVIKVTGITGFDDKWAIGGIGTNPLAVALGTKIASGTVELKMLNSDNAKAAYAEGYYNVVLVIYDTQEAANKAAKDTEKFSKVAISVEVTKGTVEVAFSEFKY